MACEILVYIDTGNVCQYEVETEAKAREHAMAIVATGYRSGSVDDPNTITVWPPHRIMKVVLKLGEPSSTKYPDRIVST